MFFLVIRDRLPGPLLYISPYLEVRRQEYYRRLQAVRERGEVQEWLRFFLGAVEHQASDAIARADTLVDLRERYRQDIMAQTRSQTPAVVDIAFDTPVLSARLVEAELDITRTGARNLLIQLEEFGVLAPYEPGPRNLRRWVAPEILRVVSE